MNEDIDGYTSEAKDNQSTSTLRKRKVKKEVEDKPLSEFEQEKQIWETAEKDKIYQKELAQKEFLNQSSPTIRVSSSSFSSSSTSSDSNQKYIDNPSNFDPKKSSSTKSSYSVDYEDKRTFIRNELILKFIAYGLIAINLALLLYSWTIYNTLSDKNMISSIPNFIQFFIPANILIFLNILFMVVIRFILDFYYPQVVSSWENKKYPLITLDILSLLASFISIGFLTYIIIYYHFYLPNN